MISSAYIRSGVACATLALGCAGNLSAQCQTFRPYGSQEGLTNLTVSEMLEDGKHQSVFGLTAAATKGDEEMCFAAGMDCYLTKPLRPPELFKLLDLHAPSHPATDQECFLNKLDLENLAVTTNTKSPRVESSHTGVEDC